MRRQAAVKLLMLGALVAGTIMLVLPATASAGRARPDAGAMCRFSLRWERL